MNKLQELRTLMAQQDLDAYIIMDADAHISEYTAPYWHVRAWFSGFTGSSGTVIVTKDEAGLWTDGRYFIQAENELKGSEITLFKMGEPDVPSMSAYLKEKLTEGAKVGFDGRTVSSSFFDGLEKTLKDKNISFKYNIDLAGDLWTDRPVLPPDKAYLLDEKYARFSASEKLNQVREKMLEKKYDALIVTGLEDMAWLLNIRGTDVSHNPVVYCYGLITQHDAHVFINETKIADVNEHICKSGFTVYDYNQLPDFIQKLTGTVYYNKGKTNMLIAQSIPASCDVQSIGFDDIISLMKAIKSDVEIANVRTAYINESAAIIKMLIWLEKRMATGDDLYETEVSEKLTELRKEVPEYVTDSFTTISAYGPNAAQAHYRANGMGDKVEPKGFLLVDTGGNYLNGTTDTTRTIPVGALTDEMKTDYTLVLKGHLALNKAIFLKGTPGPVLDILARSPVLAGGENYKHGTGHGIGFFLSVHEGPHGIYNAYSADRFNPIPLTPGMLISNEPGVYKQDKHGVRIENVILVVPQFENENGTFYGFESLTYVPYDMTAMNKSMLNSEEITYINAYHQKVYDIIAPMLCDDGKSWLKEKTKQL